MNFVKMYEELTRKHVDVHGLSIGLGIAMVADAVVLLAESVTEVADALAIMYDDPEEEEEHIP